MRERGKMWAPFLLCIYAAVAAVVPSAPNPVERYNFFNVELLQALNEELEGNLIVSPASAKLALSVLAEGTGGRTREELLTTLRLPEDRSTIRSIAERSVAGLKKAENGTEIDAATRLWVKHDLQVSSGYVNVLQRYYNADLHSLDFVKAKESANFINDWIRRATRNKINSVVDVGNISPETRLLLTSALYFKGRWLKAFDRKATLLRCFQVPDLGCQNTHFMENLSKYRYAYIPSLDADVIEIPYSDGKTSMLILLPSSKSNDQNLRVLSKDLSYLPVSVLLANLEETEVFLSIPKFSIESKLDLRPSLARMGIRDIFEGTANLTGIVSNDSLRVAGILQNAKIEVDEDGTIAAALTGITIVPLMGSTVPNFRADRPFVFMIVDLETNGTLFSGRVVQPNTDVNSNQRSS